MRFKVDISPYILNFPNLHNEIVEIEKFVHELIKDTPKLDLLSEWTIWFLINLEKNESPFGIYKKGAAYPSHPPEKTYTFHLPIPNNEDVIWGIKKKDFVYRPQAVHDMARDRVEGIEFCNFDSMSSYIVESSKKGIEQLLKKGISLKGVKIKI